MDLKPFADEVGATGPITIAGLGTRGGPVDGIRRVTAPAGVIRLEPDEMICECGAATPMSAVHAALAEVGQTVAIPDGGTIGGALAAGRSGIRRLGDGPVRDTLLQARYVNAAGELVTAGGPTVKNVSGFDLCRLLVGSRGTLGFMATVIVRTRPMARSSQWFRAEIEPERALAELYRPTSLLWDGATVWALLEGTEGDIEAQAQKLGLAPAEPPELPNGGRWSLPPAALVQASFERDDPIYAGRFVAELGVGIVHHERPAPAARVDDAVRELNRRVKERFDPTGRLNPGIDLLAAS